MSYLYKSNFPQGTPQFFSQSPKFGLKNPESLISPFLVGWLSGVLPVLHTSMVEPKKVREETLVPGHGQDFNTLFCTAWNEPKIALWNDWPRVHFVKKVGSYKMIRPAKKHAFYKMAWLTRKMSLQNGLLLLEKCPWNGTWVKPFHSGNVHRDLYIYIYLENPKHTIFWSTVIMGKKP